MEQLGNLVLPQHFIHRSFDKFSVANPDDVPGVLSHGSEVMIHHKHCEVPFVIQAHEHFHNRPGRGGVDARSRLIEQKKIGFGSERTSNQDALSLSARKFSESLARETVRASLLQAVMHPLAFAVANAPRRTDSPADAHERNFERGKNVNGIELIALRHITKSGRRLKPDLPGQRRKNSCDGLEQRRFARAIRAEQPGERAARDREIDP